MTQPDIIPGAESFFLKGNDIGCLVIHGFTSSPQMIREYAEQLHREGGYTILAPLLPGHGTSKADLLDVQTQDYVDALLEAVAVLHRHCRQLVITGVSLGGMCTIFMAGLKPDLFAAAIPINAPGQIRDADQMAVLFDPEGPTEFPNGEPDILKPDVHEILYDAMPAPAFRQVLTLGVAAIAMMPRITCPMLVMQSRQDQWVSPDNGPIIVDSVRSEVKQLLWLENSGHTATLDYDRERIGQEAIKFIKANSRPSQN
jgi:carboxylesterase